MTSRRVIRTIAGLLTAVVISGVALALVFTLWAGNAENAILRADDLGWLMPVSIAGLVGLLGWSLLSPHSRRDEETAPAMVRCVSCDAVMMQGWRICPYCGFLKDDGEMSDE